jgi:hypothetical protein
MTLLEKKIAVARLCDFYILQPEDCPGAYALRHGRDTTLYPWRDSEEEAWYDAPDYHEDLNAMHEAWNTLSEDQKKTFFKKLGNNPKFCRLKKTYVITHSYLMMGATAEDYADAFILTHGLTL